ncbi:MAG: molybdenum cofactor biosynthesis protein MoaE [Edaphobacter sp.]
MRVEILDSVIPSAEIVAAMRSGPDGAVCVFDGIVRDNTRGRKTLHLDYEAYREMALEQMRRLAAEAVTKFGVRDVALVHRLGRLMVGETSVLVVVASAHRGAGFDACRWLIDTLKKTVPIWKKEMFVDGAVWADGEAFPEAIGVSEPASQRVEGLPEQKESGRASLDNPPFAKGAKDGPPNLAQCEESGCPSDEAHISRSRCGAPGFLEDSSVEAGSVGSGRLRTGK